MLGEFTFVCARSIDEIRAGKSTKRKVKEHEIV